MIINGENVQAFRVRVDDCCVLHIGGIRHHGKLYYQMEFCQQMCGTRAAETMKEICGYYGIRNRDTQDAIMRIIRFIDGEL